MKKKDLLKRIETLEKARELDAEEYSKELKRFEKIFNEYHASVKNAFGVICERIKKIESN